MEEALQYSQLITNIIIILLFIGILIFVFKLIKAMKAIFDKVDKISGDFKDLKPKVEITIDKINSLSDNVNSLVTVINENVHIVRGVVEKVKDTADSIIEFEQKIQKRIEPPVMDTVNTIAAVSSGVKTFFDSLKNRKRKESLDFLSTKKLDDVKDSIDDLDKELEEVNSRLSDFQK